MAQTAEQIAWDIYAASRGDRAAKLRHIFRVGNEEGKQPQEILENMLIESAGMTRAEARSFIGLCFLTGAELATWTALPKITGTAKVGKVLTMVPGTLSAGSAPIYQRRGKWMARTVAEGEAGSEGLGIVLAFGYEGNDTFTVEADGTTVVHGTITLPSMAEGYEIRARSEPASGVSTTLVPPGVALSGYGYSAWTAPVAA